MASQKKSSVVPGKGVSVPARSQVAVNKSVVEMRSKTKTKKKLEAPVTDTDRKLDEVFAESLDIAVALIPTVAFAC
jgi:hypothetical protein